MKPGLPGKRALRKRDSSVESNFAQDAPPPLRLSRRQLLKATSVGTAGVVSAGLARRMADAAERSEALLKHSEHSGHFGNASVGEVDLSKFNPLDYLKDFDYGAVSSLPDGRTLREYRITAIDREIEVAPGVMFPAWTFNGRVPGPTIRATEGDLVRIHFTNAGSHPHTMHFHGFHPAGMDGVFETVAKGQTFTYEFTAEPFGLHLYHCHVVPLTRHIHKGLYGTFIVDPPGGRPPANEMVMMMNAFDTNFDTENEIYAVNTVAFFHMRYPIVIKQNELIRIYLVNITEFDPVNSFHSHATFFHEFRTGTKLEPDNFTDTIVLGQGERSILELRYRYPGDYLFHAHKTEFAELGWNGMFRVVP
jgi:FtsP/CotA-like multicopper oxidase with cupredoxin domain